MRKEGVQMKGSTARYRVLAVMLITFLAGASVGASAAVHAIAGAGVGAGEGRGQAEREPEIGATYHVRLLRVVWNDAVAGSALFRPEEVVVPLSERETWGDEQQLEALRGALGATRIEPLPGLVVRSGPAAGRDEGHLFRLGLGEAVVEIAFQGEPSGAGWHRIGLAAYGDGGTEILNSVFRIQGNGTVGLAAPLMAEHEALLIAVTPLTGKRPVASEPQIVWTGGAVTLPRNIHMEQPVYPESARQRGLSGRVMVQLVIRADGRTDGIVVLSMPDGGEWLAGAAVEAIRQWRYDPALKDGQPVDVYFNVVMAFSLEKS